uniref:Uncharacterized protein n=1 Tax=Tanacetum cinerariifolium TaxID=118510 RepID=A0A6L2MAG8_TANCI|nr:hypothetical protein [Tanacetum cinerariifolium]
MRPSLRIGTIKIEVDKVTEPVVSDDVYASASDDMSECTDERGSDALMQELHDHLVEIPEELRQIRVSRYYNRAEFKRLETFAMMRLDYKANRNCGPTMESGDEHEDDNGDGNENGLQSIEEILVHYKKNNDILTDKINVLNLYVKLRDKVLADYIKNLEKAKKERDELKLTLEKLQTSSKALNNLLESQVSDKDKTGLGYKAASPTKESFVKSSDMIENQENVESRLNKGYHAVPPPFTGNYMPPKRDLKLIDEHFESVSVDVISNIAPSNVKTVESKHKTVDVNHKGVFSTEEPKLVMKNNFSTPIIEIGILMMKVRVLDLENIKSTQAKEIADLKKRVKKIGKKEKVQNSIDEFIQDWGGLLGLKDFLVLLKLLMLVMVSTAAKVNAASEYGYYC